MKHRLSRSHRVVGLLAATLVLLPAVAGVISPAGGSQPSSRALAAWSAPEPMDYGQGATPPHAGWSAPEPMDYGLAAYATLAHFERGQATVAAPTLASR